jgi:hypothetical protein
MPPTFENLAKAIFARVLSTVLLSMKTEMAGKNRPRFELADESGGQELGGGSGRGRFRD